VTGAHARVRERPRAKGIGEGRLLAVYAQGNERQNLMAERGFVEDRGEAFNYPE